jgi:hypothetical protein
VSRVLAWLAGALLVALTAAPAIAGVEFENRSIAFSGLTWLVKGSRGRVGPGPNYFSDSVNNVWVDDQGRLHLRIAHDPRHRRRWDCAEVLATTSLGFGTYRFSLDTPVDGFDPNVVLGLFTWSDAPDYAHRELDIEFSRWSDPANQNAQFVVQPYTQPGNLFRFEEPAGLPQTVHGFTWSMTQVSFASMSPGGVIAQHSFTTGIPQPGGEVVHMNLWLNRRHAPSNGQEVEVVIRQFEFVAP